MKANSYDGLIGLGPVPTASLPRWARWAEAPLDKLPPVVAYDCHRAAGPVAVDGRLDKETWKNVPWSAPFGRLATGGNVDLETRVAFLWDDRCLYAAFAVEDPDVRGTMTGFHDHVYLSDEDVELFVDGDGSYYEMGLNALNTDYEIRWTWVEPLVERREYAQLERLFATPNYLYFAAREREHLGRHGDLDWQLPGLKHAVHVDGTLNCPEVRDIGWTVEVALPWGGLRSVLGEARVPPRPGDELRVTAYRAHHDRRPGAGAAVGWSWSVTGNDNIHVPERWNRLRFLSERPEGTHHGS